MNTDELLEKWYDTREKIKKLENKIEKYKRQALKEMKKKGTNKLQGKHYSVSKRTNTRTFLAKKNCPANVWNQYSSRCTYDSYCLSINR